MNAQFLDFKLIHKEEPSDVLTQCTGFNKKGIFLFYAQEETTQTPFLSKILSAVQLDMVQDVLVLAGKASTTFSFSDFKDAQNIHKALIFKYPPSQLGLQLQLEKYQLYTINACQYLFVDSLESIANSKQLKGQLWAALKLLFLETI